MIKEIKEVKLNILFNLLLVLFTISPIYINIESGSYDPEDWWPMFHHDANRTGFSTNFIPDINYTLWKFQFYENESVTWASPIVVDGKVYVTAPFLRCLNASTGEELWNDTFIGLHSLAPAVAYGKVFVCNSSSIHCLDAETGEHIWNFSTSAKFTSRNSAPIIVNGKVFVGNNGGVWCLNATSGIKIWNSSIPAWGPVAVSSDRVFAAALDIYCLNATTGVKIWSFPMDAVITSSPVVEEEKVFVGVTIIDNNKGVLCCINKTTGESLWNFTTVSPIQSSPAVADGRVFVASGTVLHCLSVNDGGATWNCGFDDSVDSSPAIASDKIVLGVRDTKVYCIDRNNGAIIWKYTTGNSISSSPAIAENKVFICSDDGYLYCFGPETTPPTVMITSPSNGTITNTSEITISGNASDNFQVKIVKVRINYGDWLDANGTTIWSINVTLSFGNNTIETQAIDIFNNPSPIAAINVLFDDVKPVIHAPIQTPSREEVFPNQLVTISVNITDEGSGVKNAILSYDINESSVWIKTPMNFSETIRVYEAIIPGQPPSTVVRYEIIAYDQAGNRAEKDPAGEYYTYTVIPEFSAIRILLALAIASMFSVILAKRRLRNKVLSFSSS